MQMHMMFSIDREKTEGYNECRFIQTTDHCTGKEMNMRALQIEGPGIVKEISVPVPEIAEDEVLVRVVYTGICATDYEILAGEMDLVKEGLIRYPVRFGHEFSGVVEKVGSKVRNFKTGDRVLSDPGISCGKCPACAEERWADCENMKSVGTVNCWDGSFAEYMYFPERHLYKLPKDMDMMECALIEPSCIALEGVKKGGDISGKTIVIVGTGAIGMTAVAMSACFNPAKIILVGRTDAKLEIGKKLGAHVTINARSEDVVQRVFEETNGKGADFVLETSGNGAAVNQCVALARYAGRVAYIGFYEREDKSFPIETVVSRELTICGVMGHLGAPGEVIRIMEEKHPNLLPVITHVIPFDEAADALLHPEKLGNRIKIMVKVSEE